MLGEANGGDAVDRHRQDGDEQVDKCDPVGEKGPGDTEEELIKSTTKGV